MSYCTKIKLYKTWEKAKALFVKPSLKVYFGRWKNDPNLPVWRKGPAIYVCPKKKLIKHCHLLRNGEAFVSGVKTEKWGDKEYPVKVYETTHHILPNGLKPWDYMWNTKIRRKLRKWHLGWVKPIIHLPVWMRFKVINYDVGWKTKFDDICYEFPPQFSIVAFGLSLTFTLHCPVKCKYTSDDCYWESILNYLYRNKSGTLGEAIETTGIWHRLEDDVSYFATRPTYIITERQNEYYAAVSEIRAQHTDKIII